jgi:dTMP kinase
VAADLSILVDVDVDVAAARLAADGGGDRLERLGIDFASRVREGFLTQAVADPEHWVVVDGTEDERALTAHIVAAVHDRLGDPPSISR